MVGGRSYQALGAALRAGRRRAGLSQSAVATHVDVSQGSYSRVEHGAVRFGPERLARVAAVLGLDLAELRELAGYPAEPGS